MTTRPLMAAAVLAVAVACESVESKDVQTGGMHATLTAVTEGTTTRAEATLRVGGGTSNTFVQLIGDDVLEVATGEDLVAMSEQSIGDVYYYTADFDVAEAESEFVFSLTRTSSDSAPDSRAVLPAAFDVSEPVADAVVSRSTDALSVSWTPSGTDDIMEVRVTGDCFVSRNFAVSGDPGTYVIEADTLESVESQEGEACDAEVRVQRRRIGTLDAAFGEGGEVYGAQERAVSIRIDP